MAGEIPAVCAMNSFHAYRRDSGGFTLFEMMVVMTIFVLLAFGIYSTVSMAMRATAILTEDSLQNQRLDAFVSLLRRTFHNLPASAQLSGGVRAEGGDGSAEIVLRDAPGVFAWGAGGASAGTVVLSARPRLGGGREMGLMHLSGSLGETERREALEDGDWLRLMPDLREVGWKFYDPVLQDWVVEWADGRERPPLVELDMELLGEDIPRKFVFWLPSIKNTEGMYGSPRDESPPKVTPVPTPGPSRGGGGLL